MHETLHLLPEPESLGKNIRTSTLVQQQPEAGEEKKILAQSIKVKLKAKEARSYK